MPVPRIDEAMPLVAAVLVWGLAGAPAAPPPSCAARPKEKDFLASLVGEWEVEAEFRAGEGWESRPARASIRPDLGGCIVVERYDGTRWGEPFAFLAILGANGGGADAANPIQEVFVHSQHGILSLSSGRIEDGELIVEDAPTVEGKVVLIRHVYFDVSPRGFRYESRRSTDRGASWSVSWKARYRRR